MGQSLVQVYVHIVFLMKNRQPLLKDSSNRERMYAYLAGVCENQKCPAIVIGGVESMNGMCGIDAGFVEPLRGSDHV